MERYKVTFCAPKNDKEKIFIARAVVGAESSGDAAKTAYEFLKGKYPEINRGDWLAVHSDQPLLVPETPVESPFGVEQQND
ncbi:hypothetical protein [Alloalcanivorax marinus]|uniref:hypothetical protein n=1 Tax=Alloalcanivorax marinus TaxID=1177169 RepID=UPI0019323777|nr:hypothetical protein [Alloalcanivorax marinus]MBL7252587.1 hypothetical protein [Alloalcanivorax marinus]